jgi:hypothetical protein
MNVLPSSCDCIYLFNLLSLFQFIDILTLLQKMYYVLLHPHQYSLNIYQLNKHYVNIHTKHSRTVRLKILLQTKSNVTCLHLLYLYCKHYEHVGIIQLPFQKHL